MSRDHASVLVEAFELLENEEYRKAAAVLETAGREDAQAQALLGMLYWHGHLGEDMAAASAIRWYAAAAENGHGLAQIWLANNYLVGLRTEADPKLAVYWYGKAACQGITQAKYQLGLCYASGWGTERDLTKALALMQEAAEKNFFEADLFLLEHSAAAQGCADPSLLERVEEKYRSKLRKNEGMALRYVDLLLHSGKAEENRAYQLLTDWDVFRTERGELLRADCLANGWGVERDIPAAAAIYRKFPDSRHARSKLKLLLGE